MSIYKYLVFLNVACIQANVYPDRRPELGANSYLANTMEHLLDGMESLINKVDAFEIRVDDSVNAILLKLDELRIGVDAASMSKAEWQTWSSFTSCSMSCKPVGSNGTNFRTRTRQCEYVIPNIRTSRSPQCEGNRTEIQNCEPMTCPVSSEYFGGSGGHHFDDLTVSTSKNITAVTLLCGKRFASFRFRYGDLWGPTHGWMINRHPGCGFNHNVHAERTLEFGSMECIKQINLTYGSYIDSINFITNERALGTCGTTNGINQRTVEGPGKLLYISGRAGCIIDGIKFHWSRDTQN